MNTFSVQAGILAGAAELAAHVSEPRYYLASVAMTAKAVYATDGLAGAGFKAEWMGPPCLIPAVHIKALKIKAKERGDIVEVTMPAGPDGDAVPEIQLRVNGRSIGAEAPDLFCASWPVDAFACLLDIDTDARPDRFPLLNCNLLGRLVKALQSADSECPGNREPDLAGFAIASQTGKGYGEQRLWLQTPGGHRGVLCGLRASFERPEAAWLP